MEVTEGELKETEGSEFEPLWGLTDEEMLGTDSVLDRGKPGVDLDVADADEASSGLRPATAPGPGSTDVASATGGGHQAEGMMNSNG